MFFLDAPQHGGIPCRAGLGVKKITRFVEFPEECGVRQMFVVQHEDGSTWLFEGNSQRMTGLRGHGGPLDAAHQPYGDDGINKLGMNRFSGDFMCR